MASSKGSWNLASPHEASQSRSPIILRPFAPSVQELLGGAPLANAVRQEPNWVRARVLLLGREAVWRQGFGALFVHFSGLNLVSPWGALASPNTLPQVGTP